MRQNNQLNFTQRRNKASVSISVLAFIAVFLTIFTPVKDVYAATVVTLPVSGDAMVRQSSPTNNYGSTTPLSIQGNDLRVSYLKFDLSSLATKTITSAKLRIKTVSDGGSSALQTVKLVSDGSWSESSITYNNSYNGTNANLKPSTQIGSISGGSASTWIEVILNASTVNSKKGSIFSLALMPASLTNTDDLKFNSKEASADKPVLVVEYTDSTVASPTRTPTRAASPTRTPTRSDSPTRTPTRSSSPTRTPTRAPTTNASPTRTPTRAASPTRTPTRAASPTRTPTPGGSTVSPTRTPTVRPSVTPTFGACSTTNIPTNLVPQGQLSMQSAGSYMFTWDAQQGAIKYSLRIDDLKDNFAFTYPGGVCQATNEGDVCIDNLTNNNFQFTLTPGHTYKWWVHPVNSCNAWDEAATVDLTVVNQPTPTFTPPANPSPTVTVTGEPTETPTPEGPTSTIPPTCPLHSKGDANCDGQVDFIDFEIWRQESMGEENTKNADFNGDVAVDFVDFEIWRQGYFDESPPATPTAVATIACGEDTLRCAAPPEGCQYEGGTQCTCGNLICVTTPTISPAPTLTCTPRPACLDTDSTCATEPTAGWCPVVVNPTLTPTPEGI